jgi:hypothetical protein
MVLTNPFDIVKTRLMVQEKSGVQKYRGLLHGLVTIPREEGFLRLYRGLLPRVMRVPPGMVSEHILLWMYVRLYHLRLASLGGRPSHGRCRIRWWPCTRRAEDVLGSCLGLVS